MERAPHGQDGGDVPNYLAREFPGTRVIYVYE